MDVLRPEAVFMLTSNNKKTTVKDVAREFQVETKEEYLDRGSEIREKTLERLK